MSCQHKSQSMDVQTRIVTCGTCQELLGWVPRAPLLCNDGSKEPLDFEGCHFVAHKAFRTKLVARHAKEMEASGELHALMALREFFQRREIWNL